jgi:hypothetical protein
MYRPFKVCYFFITNKNVRVTQTCCLFVECFWSVPIHLRLAKVKQPATRIQDSNSETIIRLSKWHILLYNFLLYIDYLKYPASLGIQDKVKEFEWFVTCFNCWMIFLHCATSNFRPLANCGLSQTHSRNFRFTYGLLIPLFVNAAATTGFPHIPHF